MKIRTQKYISDQRYFIEIRNEDFSEEDNKLMQKFGEPEINVGGLYGEADGTTSGWVLPDKFLRLKKGFQPYVIFFDKRSYIDAAERASYWVETVTSRIQSAVVSLRSQQDSFTSESITNV